MRDYFNQMGEMTLDQIKAVISDPKAPAMKVAAAITLQNALIMGDMADFEDVFRQDKSLEQLRADGVDTSCIKRLVRSESPDGTVTHTITLKDSDNKAIDRILDRTAGKPRQAVQIDSSPPVGVRIEIVTREEMNQVEHRDGPPLDILE